mgnify:CR=1 FL=1
MKKQLLFLVAIFSLLSVMPAAAQYQRGGHGRTNSTYRGSRHYSLAPNWYGGLRFGLSASHVNSDAPYLDGGNTKSGLNVGAVAGVQLAPSTPLFFETGLLYSEKGGKGSDHGDKFTFNLNYIEVPLVLKYSAYVAPATAVEPFVGGYMACGVGGKIKDFGQRAAYSSFNDGNFKRFDGGIRVGCGVAYEMLYAEIGYDFGLTNIGDDVFNDTHNGAFFANVGINF